MRVVFTGMIFIALCTGSALCQTSQLSIPATEPNKDFSFSDHVDLMEHAATPVADPAVTPEHATVAPAVSVDLAQTTPQCASSSLEEKGSACTPPEAATVSPASSPRALVLSVIVVIAGIVGLGFMRMRSLRA